MPAAAAEAAVLLAFPVDEKDDDGCLLCKYCVDCIVELDGNVFIPPPLLLRDSPDAADIGGDDVGTGAIKSISNAPDPILVVSHVSAVDADGSALVLVFAANDARCLSTLFVVANGSVSNPVSNCCLAYREFGVTADAAGAVGVVMSDVIKVGSSAYAKLASCFACSRRFSPNDDDNFVDDVDDAVCFKNAKFRRRDLSRRACSIRSRRVDDDDDAAAAPAFDNDNDSLGVFNEVAGPAEDTANPDDDDDEPKNRPTMMY
jgi:hypothetical protein